MKDLYIYYKVRAQHADELELRLRMMQAELGLATGIYGELKRRPDAKDGVQTWMECYLATDSSFDAALSAAVQDASLSEFIVGERHAEVFVDVSSCA
jgi:hypothetical protein